MVSCDLNVLIPHPAPQNPAASSAPANEQTERYFAPWCRRSPIPVSHVSSILNPRNNHMVETASGLQVCLKTIGCPSALVSSLSAYNVSLTADHLGSLGPDDTLFPSPQKERRNEESMSTYIHHTDITDIMMMIIYVNNTPGYSKHQMTRSPRLVHPFLAGNAHDGGVEAKHWLEVPWDGLANGALRCWQRAFLVLFCRWDLRCKMLIHSALKPLWKRRELRIFSGPEPAW